MPLSCGIVKDRVLAAIESRQNNVYGHIRQMLEKAKRREKRVTEMGALFAKEEEKEPLVFRGGAAADDADRSVLFRFVSSPAFKRSSLPPQTG